MDNLSKKIAQKRMKVLLKTIQKNMTQVWSRLTPYMQKQFTMFNKQDWRDFAQTMLETTYEEYQALGGNYLAPEIKHILQKGLDEFAERFPSWFKKNFVKKENIEKDN